MKSPNSFGAFVVCFAALVGSSSIAIAETTPRSVLILNQWNAFRPWPRVIIDQLTSRIGGRFGASSSLYAENLDIYQFRAARRESHMQTYFQDKYRDKPIELIAAIGPVALDLALRLRPALWPEAQIVFAAVDERTAAQKLPEGVTGVAMKMTLGNMVGISQTIMPDVRRFAVVGDRAEDRLYHLHLQEEISDLSTSFEFDDLTGMSLDDIRARAAVLPEHTAILYIGKHYDGSSIYFSGDILGLIEEVANRPIIIDVESLLGTGAVGGPVLSPQEIGDAAARLIVKVLEGQGASAIPVAAADSPKPVFDWRQLQRWNISESRLPPGSEIRFREPSIWQIHPAQLIMISFAIVCQTMLISWLLFEHRRRQTAEFTVRTTMAEMAHMNCVATAGVLSAAIAHEVSQPLMGIVASANAALHWLSRTIPNIDRARASLTKIVDAGHRAGDVIQTIRAMVKKDTGILASFDVNCVVQDVLVLLQMYLKKYDIALQLQLGLVPLVAGNRVQIQQVLLNMMVNAIESMSSAEGRPRLLRVISKTAEPGEVLVAVEDSGPGIDADSLQRVFEPMFTTKTQGMGMGLAICRSIIDAHHGRLWATPRVEGGSIFQFTLPSTGAGNDG